MTTLLRTKLCRILAILSLLAGSLPIVMLRASESVSSESETQTCVEISHGLNFCRGRFEFRLGLSNRKHLPNESSAVPAGFRPRNFWDVAVTGHRLPNGLLAPLLT